METLVDDKSEHCIKFILERLKLHCEGLSSAASPAPFILGINGIQGSGKTTLASALAQKLSQPPSPIPTIVISIDDLYLPHQLQSELAARYPENPLIQHRGQPSTHDLHLAQSLLSDLRHAKPTKLPSYDKSAFNGQGDRVPESQWVSVNQVGQQATRLVILEGWCVGFRALPEAELRSRWQDAVALKERPDYYGRLGSNRLEDVDFVNTALKTYDELTNQLDALVQIDAEDTIFVYRWRSEQEAALRNSKGSGMTEEEVVNFVNGYYPSYELFMDRLRRGAFGGEKGKQLRLVIGEDRRVKDIRRI